MDTRSVCSQDETSGSLIEAVNGSHLHWSDYRENVLLSFRIRCSTPTKPEQLPTTLLARLQTFQGNLGRYDAQRQAWRLDVASDRGLGSFGLFPPNLVPSAHDDPNILRCIFPRISREDLPLRMPSEGKALYELPTAKPTFVCGFNMEQLEKSEQGQLSGALSITGTVVDFSRAEVLPGKGLCCAFLAFERFETNTETDIQTARNACAVTGAQCLRGQQHLFHKAFGLQTVSQPPITFTCALNNEYAIINHHYVDDDGNYTMAALCKFDLRMDNDFNQFQAWVNAIESWSSLYLLPRIKAAVGQVIRSNPSPPPSPPPTTLNHLSIVTSNSDNTPAVLNELRRCWPMLSWHNDVIGETPINSSIAQCGTPLLSREIRGLHFPRPSNHPSLSSAEALAEARSASSMSQRMTSMLTPLNTNVVPLSARPASRPSLHTRRYPSVSTINSPCRGSFTPNSPCRPPSLSPCTPSPEAPASSKSPMLVLQKRLGVAMNEIQELRSAVDDLQGQINGRSEFLERRMDVISERQDEAEKFMTPRTPRTPRSSLSRKMGGTGWVRQLESLVEEELRTPASATCMSPAPWTDDEICEDCSTPLSAISVSSPSFLTQNIPGVFPRLSKAEEQLWTQPWMTEELVVYCLAILMKDEKANLGAVVVGALVMCFSGIFGSGCECINVTLAFALDDYMKRVLWHVACRLEVLYEAAEAYELHKTEAGNGGKLERIVEETGEVDVPLVLA